MSTARNWWIFCGPRKKVVICWGGTFGVEVGLDWEKSRIISEIPAVKTGEEPKWTESPEPFLQALKVLDLLIRTARPSHPWHVRFMRYSPHNYWHHPMTSPIFQWGRQACPACLKLSPPPRSTKVDGRHDAVSQGTDPEGIGLWHPWRFSSSESAAKRYTTRKINEGTSSKGNHISQPFDF